jgi:hypothetical protein
MLSYAEALGKCMLGRTGVAVAGTHGKSTTTAMLGMRIDPSQQTTQEQPQPEENKAKRLLRGILGR